MVASAVNFRLHPRPIPILGLTLPSCQEKFPLSFHALTWNPFCNPFAFSLMHGMGVWHPSLQKKEQLMNTTTISPSSTADPVAVPSKGTSSRCPNLYSTASAAVFPACPRTAAFASAYPEKHNVKIKNVAGL